LSDSHGCETWSLTLKEKHRQSAFENRALRQIRGFKGDEVTGEWRRLHNEELYDLYPSPNIIRMNTSRSIRWVGHAARTRENTDAYRPLGTKPEGKRPFGRLRR
jgi:hypothetical protein